MPHELNADLNAKLLEWYKSVVITDDAIIVHYGWGKHKNGLKRAKTIFAKHPDLLAKLEIITYPQLWRAYCKANPVKPCFVCGESGSGKVDRHHICDKHDYPELIVDPRNIIDLCKRHHKGMGGEPRNAEQNPIWFYELLLQKDPNRITYLREQQTIIHGKRDTASPK